ncbi:unnamed protein product [Leptidea sinapis]|uniref:Hemolin n=1 Tax=Leptidea sinapis TaxID=189913 RepID=A0A5E4R2R9_9NEOP|nr:unnamed protein product [Leptidea sinapis]
MAECSAANLRIFPMQKQQTVAVGKSVVLTCQADASDPALVTQPQWRDPKGQIINEASPGTRPEIYTEPMPAKQLQLLYISSITPAMAGNYTCEATFTNMPLSASVVLDTFGKDFKVMCEVTAEPAPSVDWFKEGTPESDDGTYTCRAVVIQTGELAERNIKLEVYTAPEMEERETKVVIKEGESAAITCKARGKPPPTYSWIKASTRENLGTASRFSVNELSGLLTFDRVEADQMQSSAVITISSLNRTDDGLYECIAENEGGEARKNGHLTVQFRPTFEHMTDMPIWSWNAQPINISCIAESIPNATIKWKFHDLDLIESPQVRIYGSGPISYVTITPTDRSLYGIYKCIATNTLGEAEHIIQVREAFPPGPVLQAKQETITATSVSFNIVGPAEEMGPPILAFTTQYKENGNYDWNLAMNRTWSINSPYIVENLMPMYTYDFRFAAVNQVGVGSWGAPITVIMPRRSPPEQPKWREAVSSESLIHGKYADKYELQWKVPAHNGEPIDMYEISYCPVLKVSGEWRVSAESDCVIDELKSYEAISYEIRGLRPDTRYRMHVRAHNILGYSLPAQLFVQTALGEYQDNEIPHRAGFYDVYTAPDPNTSASTIITPCNPNGSVERSGFAPPQLLSSGSIIGIALAGVLLCLLIVDLLLFCFRRQGVIATICGKRVKTHKDDEAKLGRDEKEPLKDTADDAIKRNSSVEFDGRRVYATSGGPIIGKNSAV